MNNQNSNIQSFNGTIASLKRSQYGDWVTAYFWTTLLAALAAIATGVLFFLYTRRTTPIILKILGFTLKLFISIAHFTLLHAILMLSVCCLQVLLFAVAMAMSSSFFFRHMPRLSLVWNLLVIVFFSFLLASAITVQFPGPLTLPIAFVVICILGFLFMGNVIRIVIKNVRARGVQQY
jgi:hypothetical protein